jgi:uncharacterized DUF497 family protein
MTCTPRYCLLQSTRRRLGAEKIRLKDPPWSLSSIRAQELWRDSVRVEVPARTTDEARWLVIGRIDGEHWSAVVAYREERIRIISVRRSRDEEVAIYKAEEFDQAFDRGEDILPSMLLQPAGRGWNSAG